MSCAGDTLPRGQNWMLSKETTPSCEQSKYGGLSSKWLAKSGIGHYHPDLEDVSHWALLFLTEEKRSDLIYSNRQQVRWSGSWNWQQSLGKEWCWNTGKFKTNMKVLSEMKMKFKGNTAIPKGISHSIYYINEDSQSKWKYLLSSENAANKSLKALKMLKDEVSTRDCLLHELASHCSQAPPHCNHWSIHFPNTITGNVTAISFCILLHIQIGLRKFRGGEQNICRILE